MTRESTSAHDVAAKLSRGYACTSLRTGSSGDFVFVGELNRLAEPVEVGRVVEPDSVHEERRRRDDVASNAAGLVFRDAPAVSRRAERRGETFDVEAEHAGVRDEMIELERALVGEQHVVHLPKPALLARGL